MNKDQTIQIFNKKLKPITNIKKTKDKLLNYLAYNE